MGAGERNWLPLESNPEVMDAYVRGCAACHTRLRHAARRALLTRALPAPRSLGFPDSWGFHDVYGFDADLLAMARVPRPLRTLRVDGALQLPSPAHGNGARGCCAVCTTARACARADGACALPKPFHHPTPQRAAMVSARTSLPARAAPLRVLPTSWLQHSAVPLRSAQLTQPCALARRFAGAAARARRAAAVPHHRRVRGGQGGAGGAHRRGRTRGAHAPRALSLACKPQAALTATPSRVRR